jgi:hypothetical protein
MSSQPYPVAPARSAVPRIRADQVEAAAQMVHLGVASRVLICNGSVEDDLPSDWEVDDVPLHLDRGENGLARVTAGRRRDDDRR